MTFSSWAVPALLLMTSVAGAVNLSAPLLPDARMTPGDVLTTDARLICRSGYTKTVRNVPVALKRQVYDAYGIRSREPGEFEVDHLISLELGGSNSVRNLWPESFRTSPLNAHVKDDLENALHAQICSGRVSVQEAQAAIAGNWTQAYVKYLGPLPGGAAVQLPGTPKSAAPAPAAVQQSRPLSSAGVSAAGTAPGADGSCPPGAPVKVSRAGIFHLPQGDVNYVRTHARSCFSGEAAAVAAGFRGPR